MQKGEWKKQSILEASEKLFFEKGYVATTIQDIISSLGCSKGSFYHHFESKLQVLETICATHAANSFDAYRQMTFDTTLERMNGLLYAAIPFRKGGEALLSLLLPLEGMAESGVVWSAILDAEKDKFGAELEKVLAQLCEENIAHCALPMLPSLCWDAHTSLYRHLMQCSAQLREGGAAGGVLQYLDAGRFLWERILDLPYGSIVIVRADEALSAVHQAIKHVNHLAPVQEEYR